MDTGKIDPEVQHFLQYNKNTSTRPTMARKMPLTVIDRLATRFAISENGCWLWKRTVNYRSYQNFAGVPAHRFMYELVYGELTPIEVIDHLCHTPGCINPKHLEAVTTAQNMVNQSNRVQLHPEHQQKLDILVRRHNKGKLAKVSRGEYAMQLIDNAYEAMDGDKPEIGTREFGKRTIRVSDECYERLEALAKQGKRKVHQQVEYLVDYYERHLNGQTSTEDIDQILATLTENAQ